MRQFKIVAEQSKKAFEEELNKLSEKYGFNLNFEGGEAETIVVDCPLYSEPIIINKSKTTWDGYRGRFEIEVAGLNFNVR